MLINIVLYVPTVVISTNNIFKCYVSYKLCSTSLICFYNNFIDTGIQLIDELCDVISQELTKIYHRYRKILSLSIIGTLPHIHNIVLK